MGVSPDVLPQAGPDGVDSVFSKGEGSSKKDRQLPATYPPICVGAWKTCKQKGPTTCVCLTVCDISGTQVCSIEEEDPLQCCVGRLKQKIEAQQKIPLDAQQLLCGGDFLYDADLRKLAPGTHTEITLVIRSDIVIEWMKTLREHPGTVKLKDIPDDELADKDITLTALQHDLKAFHESPRCVLETLESCPEGVREALMRNCRALSVLPDALRSVRGLVLTAVRRDGAQLEHAAKELKSDAVVVSTAVQENGMALQFASPRLRGQRDVVIAAIKQNHHSFPWIARTLQDDTAFALDAIRADWRVCNYFSARLLADRDVALAAVQQDEMAFYVIAQELRNDARYMLAAMMQNNRAYRFAAVALQEDRAFVAEAVRLDWRVCSYVPARLLADLEIADAALQQDDEALDVIVQQLRDDPEAVRGIQGLKGARKIAKAVVARSVSVCSANLLRA